MNNTTTSGRVVGERHAAPGAMPPIRTGFRQKRTNQPIASVAALIERLAKGIKPLEGAGAPQYLPDVSLRGAKRRGNLGKAVAISPVTFPRCSRNCEIAPQRALPRASRSRRHVGLRPPRNDKSGGHPRFIDGPLITPVQRRDWLPSLPTHAKALPEKMPPLLVLPGKHGKIINKIVWCAQMQARKIGGI